jgi:hypothetical protein
MHNPNQEELFAGVAHVELDFDILKLDHGVEIRKTYAYVFAPCMVGFKKPARKGLPTSGTVKAVGE